DYYPFGSLLPNRHGSTDDYRYGFQGQEMDNEVKGEGNSINFKFRMHDPRVGRFFAVDPLFKKYAYNSPYAFAENKVIQYNELEGLEINPSKQARKNMGFDTKVVLGLMDGTIVVAKDTWGLISDPAETIEQTIETGNILGRDLFTATLSFVYGGFDSERTKAYMSYFDEGTGSTASTTMPAIGDAAKDTYDKIVNGDAYDRTRIGTVVGWGLLSQRTYTAITKIKIGKLPINKNTIKTAFSGLDVRKATIVREIKTDDKISDIIREAVYNTMMDDVEHAVIKLTDGRKVLVSGGKHGIHLPANTELIYGHTHPSLPKGANNMPSTADREVLDFLEQSKQYIFHDGQRTTIFRGKTSNDDLTNSPLKNLEEKN
ncbi:MAG: RHS repeat-associated core domain-containing protein, partial [Algibacter sp.]